MFRSLKITPTSLGFLALFLWSTASTSASFLTTLPPFQVLMIVFLTISVVALAKIWITKEWKTLKVNWKAWLVVILGVGVQQVFYILAFKYADPAEIDVIIYLWPMMAIGFASIILKERTKVRHGVASLLGLSALLLLTFDKLSFSHFEPGHIIALLCAVAWSLYSVLMQKMPNVGMNVIGTSCVVGSLVAGMIHFSYEEFIFPTVSQGFILLYYSLCISFGAYILWTVGIQKGKASYLTLSAYMKPVVSLLLLCSFGLATLNLKLMLAVLLVMSAGLISHSAIAAYCEDFFRNLANETVSVLVRHLRVFPLMASRAQ